MQRRTLLAALGATGAALSAGCLSSTRRQEPGSSPPATDTPTGKPPTVSPGVDPQITGASIQTLDTGCMSTAGAAVEVAFGEDRVVIDGVAQLPTPCHEAAIDSVVVESNEVILRVGFPRVGDHCVDCIGALEYEAILEIEETDGVESVTVIHGHNGERFTQTRAREGRGGSSPTDTSPNTPPGSASQQPDPDLDVILVNAHDRSHEYAVTIRRTSGSLVYEGTHEVPAERERQVYNFAEADPEGIEEFTITVVVDGQEEAMTVQTSACYGNALIEMTEDGELYPYYSIC